MWKQADIQVLEEGKRQHAKVLVPNVFLAITCIVFGCLYFIRFNSTVNMQKISRDEDPLFSDDIIYYDAACSTLVLSDMGVFLKSG